MKKYISLAAVLVIASLFSSCLKEDVNNAIGELNSMASIYVVRNAYKGNDVQLTRDALGGAYRTSGIVIANSSSGNVPEGYLIIQDEWRGLLRGIVLALDAASATSFATGDSVVVDIEGAMLTRSNGGPLLISGLNNTAVTRIAQGRAVVARPVNTTELNRNFGNYENTLVSVTADVVPLPVGESFSGRKLISDGGDSDLPLVTEPTAVFANETIAPSASFFGIPMMFENEIQLRLRDFDDMRNPSGPIYEGYPEDFEAAEKGSYAGADLALATGSWRFEQALLGVTTGRDRIVSGSKAVRFQQNLGADRPSYLQMNYDVANGATKVTFWYGCYYTDASSSFILEASTDQGLTWTQIGGVISDPEQTSVSIAPKQATFVMDIEGSVRFRIRKLPLGPTAIPTVYNGRLGVDDFAIYQNY